jgi:probable F420-dependent oxidoreductase
VTAAGGVEIGLALPHFGPLATAELVESAIDVAEASGYHTLWVGDHVAVPVRADSAYPYHERGARALRADAPFFDALTTLAYAAGRTRRARLGVSVLVLPLRHPLVTAKQCATLDALAGGRLTLGVGSGWLREEFDALGIDFGARRQLFEESVAVLRSCFETGEAALDGERYSFAAVGSLPRPEQRPGPPLWLGGHADVAMRRALRLCDGWQGTPHKPEQLRDLVGRLCELAGGELPAGFAVSSRAHLPKLEDGAARGLVSEWAAEGVTHLALTLWDRHTGRYLERIESVAAELGLGRNGGVIQPNDW